MFGLNKVTGRGRQTVEAFKYYLNGDSDVKTFQTRSDIFKKDLVSSDDESGNLNEFSHVHTFNIKGCNSVYCYINLVAPNDECACTSTISFGEIKGFNIANFELMSPANYHFFIECVNGIVKLWITEGVFSDLSHENTYHLIYAYPSTTGSIDENITFSYEGNTAPWLEGELKIETTIKYN